MQEIIDFLHCTVYYTVQNTVHFVLWKQVEYWLLHFGMHVGKQATLQRQVLR